MYRIRVIGVKRYLQTTDRLPRRVENAITRRYEYPRTVTWILAATLVGFFALSLWASATLPEDASYWPLAGFVVAFVVFVCQLTTKDRHKRVLGDIASGYTVAGIRPTDCFIAEDKLVFRSIMTPGLAAYLAEPGRRLSDAVEERLDAYLMEATHILKDMEHDLPQQRTQSEKLEIEYSARLELNAIAEGHARQLIREIKDKRIRPRDFFTKQRTELYAWYTAQLTALAKESEMELKSARALLG